MAQQVTTNTDSLLNLIASTTSSSYADSSANQFASALDTATKAYNQQDTGVNTSKTDFSADSSDKLFTSNKNNTSNSSDYVNNNSNSSNNKPLTDSETNQSDNSQRVDNKTTTNNTDSNNSVYKDETKVSDDKDIQNTDNMSSGDANNTDNSDIDANPNNTDASVNDKEPETDNTSNETETSDITSEVSDIVSKYTYLKEAVDTTIQDSDNQDVSNTEDSSVEAVDDTTDSVVSDDSLTTIIDDLSQDESTDKTNTADINTISTNNVDTISQTALVSPQNTADAAQVQYNQPIEEGEVTVAVSEDLISGKDMPLAADNKNKELISQEMVDELNITIEEFSDNTTADYQTTDMGDDTTLMDSTEQVVKYTMDKAVLEDDISTQTEDSVSDSISTENVNTEQPLAQDVTEVTEDLIANSDNTDIEESKSTDNTVETEEADTTVDDVEGSTPEESQTSEHNAGGHPDKKENMKEEHRASEHKSSFDDIADIDVDANAANAKNIHVTADAAGKISGMSGVSTTASTEQAVPQGLQQNVNISKDDIIAQIHTKLQALNSTNNTKLSMVLNPESLGKVSIQLTNTSDGMLAEFTVASQQVKDILDSSLHQLKDTLSAQGVHVNDVSVKVSHSENNAQMDYTEQENSDSNKQNPEEQQKHKEQDNNKFEEAFVTSQEEQDKE